MTLNNHSAVSLALLTCLLLNLGSVAVANEPVAPEVMTEQERIAQCLRTGGVESDACLANMALESMSAAPCHQSADRQGCGDMVSGILAERCGEVSDPVMKANCRSLLMAEFDSARPCDDSPDRNECISVAAAIAGDPDIIERYIPQGRERDEAYGGLVATMPEVLDRIKDPYIHDGALTYGVSGYISGDEPIPDDYCDKLKGGYDDHWQTSDESARDLCQEAVMVAQVVQGAVQSAEVDADLDAIQKLIENWMNSAGARPVDPGQSQRGNPLQGMAINAEARAKLVAGYVDGARAAAGRARSIMGEASTVVEAISRAGAAGEEHAARAQQIAQTIEQALSGCRSVPSLEELTVAADAAISAAGGVPYLPGLNGREREQCEEIVNSGEAREVPENRLAEARSYAATATAFSTSRESAASMASAALDQVSEAYLWLAELETPTDMLDGLISRLETERAEAERLLALAVAAGGAASSVDLADIEVSLRELRQAREAATLSATELANLAEGLVAHEDELVQCLEIETGTGQAEAAEVAVEEAASRLDQSIDSSAAGSPCEEGESDQNPWDAAADSGTDTGVNPWEQAADEGSRSGSGEAPAGPAPQKIGSLVEVGNDALTRCHYPTVNSVLERLAGVNPYPEEAARLSERLNRQLAAEREGTALLKQARGSMMDSEQVVGLLNSAKRAFPCRNAEVSSLIAEMVAQSAAMDRDQTIVQNDRRRDTWTSVLDGLIKTSEALTAGSTVSGKDSTITGRTTVPTIPAVPGVTPAQPGAVAPGPVSSGHSCWIQTYSTAGDAFLVFETRNGNHSNYYIVAIERDDKSKVGAYFAGLPTTSQIGRHSNLGAAKSQVRGLCPNPSSRR
jgi:hypothetical protein